MNLAESLNLECVCSTLRPELLAREFTALSGSPAMAEQLASERPNLFSATPVFIGSEDFATLQRGVAALHRTTALPGYRAEVLRHAPAIALQDHGPTGAFMGYDFHLGSSGPRLIEINTNAGGAFLHAAAARAHGACCERMRGVLDIPIDLRRVDEAFIAMFRAEWRAQRGDTALRTVAIVDDDPAGQFLAHEFELARELFLSHGIAAVVADPRELRWHEGRLWRDGLPAGAPVDLVYNRLTDFDLSQPAHAALRDAYVCGGAVVTPSPRAHALHADKRNLIALSDDAQLAQWGVPETDRTLLSQVVPKTQAVTRENADALWTQRRHLFFKPAGGYGSKAAYRGDKLTRRVWAEIVEGGFVAQELVAPSERLVDVVGLPTRLKLDLRAYAYAGRILLLAARTYAGQTTNFRTPGGGFSPVIVLPSLQ
jgi:hypothetical protein